MAFEMKKHALLLILGYLGTAGLTGGAGYWMYDEYCVARDEKAEVEKQVQMADAKISRIPSLETDVICLRENVSELVKILPSTKEVNEFVNKLNDFAQESHVRIDSLKPDKDTSKTKDVFDKVIYKTKMVANLGEFLQFLSLCEGYERFVKVTSLDVKAGKWEKEMAREDVRHEISVELETYSYRGNDDPAKSTTIINYEKRRDALKDEIATRRSDIRVEHFKLVPNPLRRDPFVDPRRRVSDEGNGGLPYPEQKALVDALVAKAQELIVLADALGNKDTNFIRRLELETEIDNKVATLQADLERSLSETGVTDLSLRRSIERDVMPILKKMNGRDTMASAAATLEDLRRFAKDMRQMLQQGNYQGVLQKHKIIAGRIDAKLVGAEGGALLQQIDRCKLEAEVAMDFAKKAIEIKGAVVQDTGSVVVVNGRVLREGDNVEDDLVVHHIAVDRVEFRYKGVVLARAR